MVGYKQKGVFYGTKLWVALGGKGGSIKKTLKNSTYVLEISRNSSVLVAWWNPSVQYILLDNLFIL